MGVDAPVGSCVLSVHAYRCPVCRNGKCFCVFAADAGLVCSVVGMILDCEQVMMWAAVLAFVEAAAVAAAALVLSAAAALVLSAAVALVLSAVVVVAAVFAVAAPRHHYTPLFNEVERGVYWFHLVRLSVCGQNRVRSVSSTILVGSISYLHILSSNFRRCVACNVCSKIPPASTKYTGFTLSVCPSVDRIVSVLYLQQYLLDPFHICTSYQATSEGVSRVMFVPKF